MESLHIELSQNLKQKPDPGALGFGQYFSDHMLTMAYSLEAGWHDLKSCLMVRLPLILRRWCSITGRKYSKG